jgi:peptide/nickel transport system ATP-binding protein
VGLSLGEIQGRYPGELSGGQLQRLSVARSLITRPRMIVADEPVSMIDASLRMSIVNLFRTLREEKNVSVIYITHDLATAYYVSDRIAIMLRGSIVEMGSVEKVLDDPLHPYTRILKESVPFPDLETREFSRAGCKFAGRCPNVKDICRNVEPSLQEVKGRMVKCHLYPSSKGESR